MCSEGAARAKAPCVLWESREVGRVRGSLDGARQAFVLRALEAEALAGLGKEALPAKTCSFFLSLDSSVLYPGDQKQQGFFSPVFQRET